MQRRTVLAGIAAAFAGCPSTPGDTESTVTPADRPAVTTRRSTPGIPGDRPSRSFDHDDLQRRVSLEGVDETPADSGLAIDVDLLRGRVTGEETARLRITVKNEDDERFVSYDGLGCAMFHQDSGISEDGALWLIEPDLPGIMVSGTDRPRAEPLWVLRHGGPGIGLRFPMYGCLPERYAADESTTTAYQLWDGIHDEGYMPPGVHRFETTVEEQAVTISEETDRAIPGETVAEFIWGLKLRVENP